MKKLTLWQRLNTPQAVLILLLIVGVGLTLWVETTLSKAAQRGDQLNSGSERIRNNMTQMGDALRWLLLDPKNEEEKKRRTDTENDLRNEIDTLQSTFLNRPELVRSLKNLHDFTAGDLREFHRRTLEILASDPAAATAFYNQNQNSIRKQRDALLSVLERQAAQVRSDESSAAWTIAGVGMTCITIVLIACIVVVQLQSSAVTEPLNQLVSALERMRRGDFTQRLALDRRDEFGVMGDGLNRLAGDLSTLVGQVQRSGIQVNTTSTEISATAKEQQSTANEIAATTAEIGATSKEISATSRELVKTMNEVSQVAEDTAQLANSGQNAIGRMEATMRAIMEASGSITSKLAVLSEKTANINSVVTTITKVADQTNLLSLNAAIEAEKAGEYGLGFAVVAMEIRRLADQTAVATYDIEKMVKEMQSAVAAGVMGMDKFSEEVRRGVEEIRQVSTQLAQIIHQVQTLTPRFQTVNEGMHAQATGAQQISETLTQLSEAAHQTAESLRQSNLAIEQLNEAARGLQTSVARFRLEAQ